MSQKVKLTPFRVRRRDYSRAKAPKILTQISINSRLMGTISEERIDGSLVKVAIIQLIIKNCTSPSLRRNYLLKLIFRLLFPGTD